MRIWLGQLNLLFQVIGNEFGHFEHRYLSFATEDSFELVVCIDHAAVCCVLEIKLLDVVPDFLGHFGAWQRRCAFFAAGFAAAAGLAAAFLAGAAAGVFLAVAIFEPP
jgi:hypothetical protein